jgi:hypothetical protein
MYGTAGQIQDNTLTYLTTVAGTNVITAVAPVLMSAYATGQTFYFIAAGGNTGAVTVNINAIGAKAVKKTDGSALISGDILTGAAVQIMYDGTNFQLLSDSNGTNETVGNLTVTGTTTATGLITANGGVSGALNGSLGATTPSTVVATDLTTTGNTILGNASTDTLNVGNGDLVKDASGNVGIGVTPPAWGSAYSVLQMGTYGTSLSGYNAGGGSTALAHNAYIASPTTPVYSNSFAAAQYSMDGSGSHYWLTAPSGTAGNAITFTQAMTLDASGNLSNVGTYNNSRIVGGTYAITTGNSLTITLATGALTNRGAFMVIGGVTQGVGSHTGLYVIGGNANLVSTVLAATNIAVTSNTTAGTIIITNNTGQTMNGNYFVTS